MGGEWSREIDQSSSHPLCWSAAQVPVITMVGHNHASNVGVSLLTAIGGCDALIGRSEQDYADKAVALAGNLGRYQVDK
jgi:predicted O-linked N-acetylglucosamine transferase (SPINDLY family)